MAYSRDAEICGEAEPSEYLYRVISGAVRTYKILADGRRQICAFNMRAEYFGVESEDIYGFSADAIADSRVLAIKRSILLAEAERDMEVARQIRGLIGDELKRAQSHVLLLIKTAKERVAAFLLEMAARTPAKGEVELPMCRQDIADYLGLTIETVSRMLADLERTGAISLPNSRRVILRDLEVLAAHAG
jgi:CRP/FNR family nitrogen fixation transcriptional regulator